MATIATARTFAVTTPDLMEGDDIACFQSTLSEHFDAWSINKQVSADGRYGRRTRAAAREVCSGLGIDPETAMKDGVSPQLRAKLRDPDERTDVEVGRSLGNAAKHFRADLRRQYADVGRVVVAAGANRPGAPISKLTGDYIARMAHRLATTLTITCGTDHDAPGPDDEACDHASGHAADLGMSANGGTDGGPVGDRIMIAALVEAGSSIADATSMARAGGSYTIDDHEGMHIQCIWKTDGGADHRDHVHIGVRPAD